MLSDDISAPQSALGLHNSAADRRFQRVAVSILGRYMLADRREFPCQVLSMSPGDAVVIAPVPGIVGERIVAYVVLGESLGSMAANLHAGPGRLAVGVDINATHTRSATSGWCDHDRDRGHQAAHRKRHPSLHPFGRAAILRAAAPVVKRR